MPHFDVAVIGTGPAGQKAAIQAAKLGRRVVAIERGPTVGGGAIATGTIPSKTLREAVLYLTGFRQRGLYGVSYRVKETISIQDITYRVDHVLRREVSVVEAQLSRNNVELIHGEASFTGPQFLSVAGDRTTTEIEADAVIVAVGSEASHSPHIPIDGRTTFDTENIMQVPEIPRTMTIVGGGVVGMEYASIFAALGVKVTLLEQWGRVLEFVDQEIGDALTYHMRDQGVTFRLGEKLSAAEIRSDTVLARTASNKTLVSDCLLYTAGRQAATGNLGLEALGIETDERGRIKVNDQYQTVVPGIYAVGDVIGFPSLAATAMRQGRLAARIALGAADRRGDEPLPYGIYTVPEIGMIGRTEEQLTDASVPYEVGVAKYSETARGAIVGDSIGRLKMLIHSENRSLLGVHIIGEGATELIHIGQAVIVLGGTLSYFLDNVFNYPTLAECYKTAALDADNKLAKVDEETAPGAGP